MLITILGLQNRGDNSDVLNFVTDAVKLWKSEFSGTYPLSTKPAKLSQQQHRSSCIRHNKPNTYLENRCITCVTAVAPRVLQTTLFTLLQLIGLPVLVSMYFSIFKFHIIGRINLDIVFFFYWIKIQTILFSVLLF